MTAAALNSAATGPLPFRGALPSIRFSTGAIVFLIGLTGLYGRQTGLDVLSRGAEDWVQTSTFSAYAFMAFGALMMVSYSLAARRLCWMLMITVGLLSLVHHWSVWSGTPLGRFDRLIDFESTWIRPLAAFLIFLTGVRIWAATRAHRLAPVLDGVILGLAAATLVGYLTGFEPLYRSGLFDGISFLESLGFLAIGGLFLLADVEYARLNLRARRLPAALGISALAAVISLRVSEAVLDGLGHRGLEGLLGGEMHPPVLALAATNTLMSLSIGAAAMLLLAAHDAAPEEARHEVRLRRVGDDLCRTAGCLDAALAEIARGHRTAAPVPTLRKTTVDVATLAAEVLARTADDLARHHTRVLKAHADGRVHADPGWLGLALASMIREAAARTADRTPLVSLRLDHGDDAATIRLSFGGTTPEGPFAPPAGDLDAPAGEQAVAHGLGLADAIARWHGGRFRVTSSGSATTMHLTLPAPAPPAEGAA